jgi:hypothetical protein
MNLNSKQQTLLRDKYLKKVKDQVIHLIKTNGNLDDMFEFFAELSVKDSAANAKLVGVKTVPGSEFGGFATEAEMDSFADEVAKIFDGIMADIVKAIEEVK